MLIRHLAEWRPGRLLAFSGLDGETDYHHGLVLRTSPGEPGLDVKFPAEGKIRFAVPAGQDVLLCGDCLSVGGGALRGAFVDAHHFLLVGGCSVELDDKLAALMGEGRTLVAPQGFLDPAHLGLDIDALVADRLAWLRRRGAGASKTVCLALSQLKTQVCSPEGPIKHCWTTPDRWPHKNMWLWDSVFHAAGLRHVEPGLAQDSLDAVLDVQRADGFVPLCAPGFGQELTQPPVLALGYQLVDETVNDPDWLRGAYGKLKKYLHWDLAHRDSDGHGLLEWHIEAHENCRSGESGMDNSPRFDAATQLDAVDFNSMVALECEIMAGFAQKLGLGEAAEWLGVRDGLRAKINERLWDEDRGFYFDYDVATGERSEVMAVSGFLPLLCGACDQRQAERLAARLRDPDTFGRPFPLPSVAFSDKTYDTDMWRGPTWINYNWLVARGLKRYGLAEAANQLVARTVAEIEASVERHGTFFEYFDPEKTLEPPALKRKGKNAPEVSPFHQVMFDYGWTATLYLDMIMSKHMPHGNLTA